MDTQELYVLIVSEYSGCTGTPSTDFSSKNLFEAVKLFTGVLSVIYRKSK
jgi:hypothetical protein